MIKRLILLFLLFICGSARADYYWINHFTGNPLPSAVAACQEITTINRSWTFVSVTLSAADSGDCYFYQANSTTAQNLAGVSRRGTPPVPPPNACADVDTKNPWISRFAFPSNGLPMPKDDGTCQITMASIVRCYSDPTGQKYCFVKYYKQKAAKPTPEPDAPSPPAPKMDEITDDTLKPKDPADKPSVSPGIKGSNNGCPDGTVSGGVDSGGVPICIGMGTNPVGAPEPTVKTSAPQTTTTPDGVSTTIQKTERTNSDGSTSTTTTTTVIAPSGEKTVSVKTETSKATDGVEGKQDTPQDGFCKQNPDLAVCKNSSVSGACESISCTGDAIQCATLRAAAAMQCKGQKDADELKASPQAQLGDQMMSGNDPKGKDISDAIKGTDVDVFASNLDKSGFLTASCLADRSFSVMGRPVTMSFNSVCNNVQPLRFVFMSMALLIVYMTIAKSVISGGV